MRRIALIELADLEEPDVLLWLVDRLRGDPSIEVRTEAARLLEAWEEVKVVQVLCEASENQSTQIRESTDTESRK